MRTLSFNVKGQAIRLDPSCNFRGLVAGSNGYLNAKFNLDSSWDGCRIAASFWNGKDEYAVLLENSECKIPTEALSGNMVGVSLTGKKNDYQIKTNKVYFRQEVL